MKFSTKRDIFIILNYVSSLEICRAIVQFKWGKFQRKKKEIFNNTLLSLFIVNQNRIYHQMQFEKLYHLILCFQKTKWNFFVSSFYNITWNVSIKKQKNTVQRTTNYEQQFKVHFIYILCIFKEFETRKNCSFFKYEIP